MLTTTAEPVAPVARWLKRLPRGWILPTNLPHASQTHQLRASHRTGFLRHAVDDKSDSVLLPGKVRHRQYALTPWGQQLFPLL